MADLRTDFVDDVLDTTQNLSRVYNIKNRDGSIVQADVMIEDTSVYTQTGSTFGATQMNETNKAVNDINQNLSNLTMPYINTKNKIADLTVDTNWVATEDCIVTGRIGVWATSESNNGNISVIVDGVTVAFYSDEKPYKNKTEMPIYMPIRKGTTIKVARGGDTSCTIIRNIIAYGVK